MMESPSLRPVVCCFLLLLLLIASFPLIPKEAGGAEKLRVYVVGTGRVSTDDMDIVESSLREYYGDYIRVEVLDDYLLSPERGKASYRYNRFFRTSQAYTKDYFIKGMELIESRRGKTDIDVLVIVTDMLLYNDPSWNYAFGEAFMGDSDRVCVFSTWYLKNVPVEGEKSRGATYARRLGEIAAHEVGHTLGLHHVLDTGCLMYYEPRFAGDDSEKAVLCRDSRRRLLNTIAVYQCSKECGGIKFIDHLPPVGCYLKSTIKETVFFMVLILSLAIVRSRLRFTD